jgi:NADH-quinone oxidoreductase subunit K
MPVTYYIILSIALFVIGMVGVLTRRNAIIIFMCIEIMLNAVNLLLVAFSKMHHVKAVAAQTAGSAAAGTEGQLFVFFIMVVAAAEVSVGLAIIVMMYRNIHSVDVNFLNRLKH